MRFPTPATLALALSILLAGFGGMSQAATVLITGANSGIGLEFARQYAALHWTVIATHRHDHTPATLAQLASSYPEVRVEKMDVSNEKDVTSLAQKLQGVPIDVLINNAAVYAEANGDPGTQSFGKFNFALWDTIFAVNVKGPLMVTQAFYANVKTGQQKKVVAISSTNGSLTHSPPGTLGVFYRASKAALNKEMQLTALDLKADRIAVIMLHPGVVKTERFFQYSSKYGPFDDPAALDPPSSVKHMIATIGHVSLHQTGHFMRYDGKELPW